MVNVPETLTSRTVNGASHEQPDPQTTGQHDRSFFHLRATLARMLRQQTGVCYTSVMNDNPIITRYRQQTANLLLRLNDQLRQPENAELMHALNQFKHAHEQIQDYVEQLQAVIETAALLTSALDVDDVLEHMLDTVIEATGAERAFIMLREIEDAMLYTVAARAWDRENIDEADRLFSRNIVDYVLQTRKPVIALNAQKDPRFEHIPSVHSKSLRSLLCVPMLRYEQVIGVLYADNRITKGVFQETLLPVMEVFAHYAVIALENARRFQQTTNDLRESQRQIRYLQVQAANQRLADPLTERELEVLALIASGLSNVDIAGKLSVGISTVKKHINHIYGKLQVENRGRAIIRAQELSLV